MDPEGSVLVCNSFSNSIGYGETSPIVGPSNIENPIKSKRKRYKRKKEQKETPENVISSLQNTISEISCNPLATKNSSAFKEMSEMLGEMQDVRKAKKTRTRKKKENKLGSASQDAGHESKEMLSADVGTSSQQPREPFFTDNKQISKDYLKELSNVIGSNEDNFVEDLSEPTGDDIVDFMSSLRLSPLPQSKKRRKRKKAPGNKDPKPSKNLNLLDNMHKTPSKSESNENDEILLKVEEEVKKLQLKFQMEGKTKEFFFKHNKDKLGKKAKAKQKSDGKFPEYLTPDEVVAGLENKTMIAGPIRINARNYKEAYISSEGDEKDIIIEGMKNRNRALEGDEVVVLINPVEERKTNSGQRTGKVVYIQEEVHMRSCIGKLPGELSPDNTFYIVFSPRDSRVPRIKISLRDNLLPKDYLRNPKFYSNSLFQAKITAWRDVQFAEGKLMGIVGQCGDVESETLAILLENNLDPNPINPVLNIFFPRLPYSIPEEEIAKRLDLRKECIFTIDPATARDLDDAVSAKVLDNGNILVGVHISDVSHFLHHGTMLDETVQKRATTIYLVQRVYHMLPVELCHLCSLTPGEDKLAFSVFMELNADARIVSHHFARTVIHSCVQFSYEHAQMVIDDPEKKFSADDFPEITNGFSAGDCVTTIRHLYRLSQILRKRRFDSGALRIDMPKLCFHLDKETQSPLSSFIYENKESHRLIEEFMLMANMTVAEHIYAAYPTLAFLRQHKPPKLNMISELQKRLELFGINLNTSTAGTLHSSMVKYSTPVSKEDEPLAWARHIVLNNLCAKPMVRANYFCPSEGETDIGHYALNAPCYTHFTSPIRRYADIMVHRLLASSLGLAPPPSWTRQSSKKIADTCNRQKVAAKVAGEQSGVMFLSLFLVEPVECVGAVIDVKDHSMDVIVQEFGVMVRVYTDNLRDLARVEFSTEDKMPKMFVQWKGVERVHCIQLFSLVRLNVHRAKEGLKIAGTLLPPLS